MPKNPTKLEKSTFTQHDIEILNIDIANADQSKISIMNYLGQTNFTTTNQKQIDITNFTSGLYFITIEFGHKIFTQKFIKQ
jgi:hypothetical protein